MSEICLSEVMRGAGSEPSRDQQRWDYQARVQNILTGEHSPLKSFIVTISQNGLPQYHLLCSAVEEYFVVALAL